MDESEARTRDRARFWQLFFHGFRVGIACLVWTLALYVIYHILHLECALLVSLVKFRSLAIAVQI